MIDFSKLGVAGKQTNIFPRDIFMSLPAKNKLYEYPRDVQSDVWKQWFEKRNEKNCIIKMNTGSGKTVVGLLILKSCLHEGKGPAIYVVPDKFLVQQVTVEAQNLGIKVTEDELDIDFLRNKAIMIVTIHRLVNGKSIFGMRQSGNVRIGSVVIDDIHACLATIESQFTISILSSDPLYSSVLELFYESLAQQSENNISDIIDGQNPYVNMLVPFWDWQKKVNKLHTLFRENSQDDNISFHYPLLADTLQICNCMITSKSIEITPKCIPIHKIKSFVQAERRIFMSATLADDSIFVSALGLAEDDLSNIITPEKANDIGDRLILFPQTLSREISDSEIKLKLKELSLDYNVIVIVPSNYRLNYWSDVADLSINASNIEYGIRKLKGGHVGLAVLLNKYDGIDLPDGACRILVIDGLPKMRSEFDIYEQNAIPSSKRLLSEQIQKIEQGMGRGVRSNSDYCVIILMGRSFADILYNSNGYIFFSEATREQMKLSDEICEQLIEPNINDIFDVANLSLNRDIEWITTSKERLSSVGYPRIANLNKTSVTLRRAYDFAELSRYREAVDVLTEEKNKTIDIELRGLSKQYMAEYLNFANPIEAQQLLLSALSDNRALLKPIIGINFERVSNKTGDQSNFFVQYHIEHHISANQYALKIETCLEQLIFSQESANQFEAAIKDISFCLGIFSIRPENETGKGPDNFWDIGNSEFFVIECKNGTITDTICKHDCNQLNGSINWFEYLYRDMSSNCIPIMIHNSNVFEYACSPNNKIRIMTPLLLEKLKDQIRLFTSSVTKPEVFNNPVEVNKLLVYFKLRGIDIVGNYSTSFSIKNQG